MTNIPAAGPEAFISGEPSVEIIDASDWLRESPPDTDPVLLDTFDAGDKVAVVAASKTRKSFYALQLAISLAAGKDFLSWGVSRPRQVLVVQMEIQERHYWRRVRRMAEALKVGVDDLDERLMIVNGRGHGLTAEQLKPLAEKAEAEVVIIDPLYKLSEGDENSAGDMGRLLSQFDELATATGAAVVYVHHDAKGSPGDRDTRDRGSGSGVLGRDYDACMTLTEHRDEGADAAVVQALLRNYPPQEGFAIRWADNHFQLAPDLLAEPATSRSKAQGRRRGPDIKEIAEAVKDNLLTRVWRIDALKAEIQSQYSVGRQRAEDVVRLLSGWPDVEVKQTETFPTMKLIGPPGKTRQEAGRLTTTTRQKKEAQ